jgi:hypothetical protein
MTLSFGGHVRFSCITAGAPASPVDRQLLRVELTVCRGRPRFAGFNRAADQEVEIIVRADERATS